MKLYVSARINSEKLESSATYHLVKDGIGGISVLKDGYRIGFLEGEAAGCLPAEQLDEFFGISCRAMPVVSVGSNAVFCIMGKGQRIAHTLKNLLRKKPAQTASFDPIPYYTVKLRRYPLADLDTYPQESHTSRRSAPIL